MSRRFVAKARRTKTDFSLVLKSFFGKSPGFCFIKLRSQEQEPEDDFCYSSNFPRVERFEPAAS